MCENTNFFGESNENNCSCSNHNCCHSRIEEMPFGFLLEQSDESIECDEMMNINPEQNVTEPENAEKEFVVYCYNDNKTYGPYSYAEAEVIYRTLMDKFSYDEETDFLCIYKLSQFGQLNNTTFHQVELGQTFTLENSKDGPIFIKVGNFSYRPLFGVNQKVVVIGSNDSSAHFTIEKYTPVYNVDMPIVANPRV